VAERAEVSERTVYRQFGDQRGLRDAVMRRFEEEAGVDLSDLALEDVAGLTARILGHVAAYPLEPRPLLDPTLVDANHRRREALLHAVAEVTEGWAPEERAAAAGVLDLLWGVAPYERLVVDWDVDRDQAIRTVTWVVGLVERALRDGDRPT
jgi:AcrR family transcriptional regulator